VSGASGCSSTKTSGGDGGATVEPAETDAGGTTDDGGVSGDAGDAGPKSCLGGEPAGDAGDAGAFDCDSVAFNGCDVACRDYQRAFKPDLAAKIGQCLLTLPTCEGTTDRQRGCTEDALAALAKAPCEDPSAKTFCAPLVAACAKNGTDAGASFNASVCQSFAQALTSAGRSTFLTCVTEGVTDNCTADPLFCIDSFK
jgi:hypothetical protein